MLILPAIDIIDGQCVRLYQGDYNKKEVVGLDPCAMARSFTDAGACFLHIVDLDGALEGKVKNLEVIESIAKHVPIEVGGGVRDEARVEALLAAGVARVILGTKAAEDEDFLKYILGKYGKKIAVGIDALNEKVATHGWRTVQDIDYIEFAKKIESFGGEFVIFTDISTDGTLNGPNYAQLAKLQDTVSMNIIASGGVSCIDDLAELRKMNLYGTIVGKAIYSGNIDINEIDFGEI